MGTVHSEAIVLGSGKLQAMQYTAWFRSFPEHWLRSPFQETLPGVFLGLRVVFDEKDYSYGSVYSRSRTCAHPCNMAQKASGLTGSKYDIVTGKSRSGSSPP